MNLLASLFASKSEKLYNMLCSKCRESISQGKEIQIEGTTICKECALIIEKENKEKVIARCWNCNRLINRGELVHEISRNDSKNWINRFSLNLENYEKMAQCDDCYQEWRNKVKKGEKWLEAKGGILYFCLGIFIYLIAILFFSERIRKMKDETSVVIFLFILLFIIIFLSGPVLNINRYEFKKRKKDKKK